MMVGEALPASLEHAATAFDIGQTRVYTIRHACSQAKPLVYAHNDDTGRGLVQWEIAARSQRIDV
jgi:hypothetical protein